ncbi:MAG TPA: pyridoxine 5'-phosphate synthase [bacterium]|nr:pyridoxine 5'-phosphate synthase [bacterium]
MIKLGVNIDHIATVREARKTYEPDPVAAASICELAGADCITVHLREDRRHIQDRDVEILRRTVATKLNLEMAPSDEIIRIACRVKPDQCTLVPEKRQEVTTEGGLDVKGHLKAISAAVARLRKGGMTVSLFIDPEPAQIAASAQTGAEFIEIHTGAYANARAERDMARELEKIERGVASARKAGLRVNAGHGLNYTNVIPLCAIPHFEEFNIGHSIISRAVLVGLDRAVRDMAAILKKNVKNV